jgi:catechol 2,3-dioxygenase-like lactoylglutathione lyase family enzyme
MLAQSTHQEVMVNAMGSARIHHVGIAVGDAEAAHIFYRDVLGLAPVERPEGAVAPGSWLQLGNAQVHLLERNETIPPHFAIEVENLAQTIAAIREHGVEIHQAEHIPGFGRQAFLADPSGNWIELNQPG